MKPHLGQRVQHASCAGLFLAAALFVSFYGCKTLETLSQTGVSLNVGSHVIDTRSIAKSLQAVAKTFEDITPEQEYYIGRAVGAVVVSKYHPYNNPEANRYINLLGQTLAQASDLPETFGGYRFLILDSEDINAFAAPGGLIFVTRGMLRCCQSEDAAAAVLAHEIGHIQLKHGLQAIQKSRVTTAVTTLAVEGAKTFGGEELSNLTRTFEGSISDITSTMINHGYSRAFEREADMAAMTLLQRVGYDPNGLVDMLRIMQERLKPGGLDFAKTHPLPESRIADIRKDIQGSLRAKKSPARQPRFLAHLGNI